LPAVQSQLPRDDTTADKIYHKKIRCMEHAVNAAGKIGKIGKVARYAT